MTRVTVSQAVEAIRNETTADGIKVVLMGCAKTDMVKIHDELTGTQYGYSANSKKKE